MRVVLYYKFKIRNEAKKKNLFTKEQALPWQILLLVQDDQIEPDTYYDLQLGHCHHEFL